MSKLYPVQEIGSLAKPRWRTKGLTQPLSSKDLVEAEEWAQRLGIPDFQDRAKQLLAAQEQNDRVRELLELSTIYGLRLFEQTGLEIAEPDVAKQLVNLQFIPIGKRSPEELDRFVKSETARWAKVLQQAG